MVIIFKTDSLLKNSISIWNNLEVLEDLKLYFA